MLFSRLMPALRSYPGYRRADLAMDVIAGITVAVMLVPQAMAYAMLAGLPPVFVPLLLPAGEGHACVPCCRV